MLGDKQCATQRKHLSFKGLLSSDVSEWGSAAHALYERERVLFFDVKLKAQQKLAEQQAELEREIAAVRSHKKTETIQKIRALMAEQGITRADLEPTKNSRCAKTPTVKSDLTSGVIHRDPASGALTSGRGRQPAWSLPGVVAGRDLFALAVPAA